ncbi:PEP-CTERM system TPR-repeat protein PrsT [Candidatus Berkiella cookevillensis]|uniref:PEP-CTERM system TPR-repeat protein PrsT n=1 Tax=Candidatus Berkiella cookevillensis TaxID=437022 RepID=A0A0Q9YGY0_9GAMM|nr:XrtA/PEP-CTERM system TPR-repeat protein PrsT [Candidatus Berkiella cookevillensis]MCS5708582.1 PEP-CTERM system TPR-repeat protein PrsT [Candidatus Berkiella cookevillensis]
MTKLTLTTLVLLSSLLAACNNTDSENVSLNSAIKDYNEKNYAESLLHLRRAIQLKPDQVEARKLIADVLLKIGEPLEAERHIRKAIELGASKNETLVLLGMALIKQKKYDDTLNALDSEGDLHSAHSKEQAMMNALKGQAQLGKGLLSESISSFNRAIALDSHCVRAYLGLATLYLSQNEKEKADVLLNKAFEINDKDPDVWTFKGDLERIQGHLKDAIKSYSKAVNLSLPTSLENQYARLYRALVLAHQSKFEDAWRDIRKVKIISGENIYLNYVSGIVSFLQHDYAKSQSSLERVINIAPDHLLAHFLLGTLHYVKQQPEQARKYLLYFINKNPDHILAQKMLAMVEFNLGDVQSAEARLTALLDKDPTDSSTLNMLGQHYLSTGKTEKGLNLLGKSLEENPHSFAVQLKYGIGSLEMGEYQLAEKAFNQAMQINHDSMPAQFYQFLSLLKQNKPEKAIEFSDQLLAQNPKNIMANNFEGIAYIALRDLEKARAQFDASLAIDKGDPTAHFNLANLDYSQGNKANALAHLKTVVEHHPKFVRGYLKLAQYYNLENDQASAQAWLLKALEHAPNDLQASLALSKIYVTEKRLPEALSVLSRLTPELQKSPKVLLALAEIYGLTEQYALAQQTLNQYEMNYTHLIQSENYLSLRASLYSKEGQFERSAHLYQQLQKKHPHPRWVIDLAANYWLAQKEPMAISTLENWLDKYPKDGVAQISLANYYLLLKNNKEALKAYIKADSLVPNHPIILNNMAWLLKESDLNLAFEIAERALKLSPDLEDVQHTYKVIADRKKVKESQG